MSEHLAGRDVSASTYRNHRCRCDGCRAANTASALVWLDLPGNRERRALTERRRLAERRRLYLLTRDR